jgi:transposase
VRGWLLTPPAELEPAPRAYIERLLTACPAIAAARDLTAEFGRLVRERDLPALAPWLAAARASELAEFREFALGIERDRAAMENALQYQWSNGPTEAQVLQVKRVRRQMQGRGKLDLLRRRVIQVA